MVTCTLGQGPGCQPQVLNLSLLGYGSQDGAAGTELIPSTVRSVKQPRTVMAPVESHTHMHTYLTRLILNPQHSSSPHILFSLFYKRETWLGHSK